MSDNNQPVDNRTRPCCGGVGAHAESCNPDIPVPAGAETDGWTMTNDAGDLVRSLVWWTREAGPAGVDIDGDQDSTGRWSRGISIFGLEGPYRYTAADARSIAAALLAGAAELDRLDQPPASHPVDPTGPLTIGTIPDADLDRMIDATIAPSNLGMDDRCCLGYPDSEPCNQPVQYYALAACAPALWLPSAGASLGAYCSIEHAEAELRPSLDEAKRTQSAVLDGTGRTDPVNEIWRRLIDNYPHPIPAVP